MRHQGGTSWLMAFYFWLQGLSFPCIILLSAKIIFLSKPYFSCPDSHLSVYQLLVLPEPSCSHGLHHPRMHPLGLTWRIIERIDQLINYFQSTSVALRNVFLTLTPYLTGFPMCGAFLLLSLSTSFYSSPLPHLFSSLLD